MKAKYFMLPIFLFLGSLTFCQETEFAMDEPFPQDGIDLFASEEPLQMIMIFDMKEFFRSKNEPAYMDAILSLKMDGYNSVSQRIKIKARGEMRRNYCSFPPIMLKFKDGKDNAPLIQGKGKIKLVTPCNQSLKYENYVLKEYLAYKLFNQVTSFSFKTRLAKIKYVDINNPEKNYTAYCFLIENEDHMAERNNTIVIESKLATQKHMQTIDMARVALFNYMVGNTDWSIPTQHNIKILKPLDPTSNQGIPVAYDFDYSGFVDASYAAPNEELPIKTVNERYYTGLCLNKDEIQPIIEEFGEHKEVFLNTIHDFNYLPPGTKKQLSSYIEDFYKVYNYKNVLLGDLNQTCKRL